MTLESALVRRAAVRTNLVGERDLAAAARTDPAAFARLYQHYLPRIHAFAYRRTNARDVAEDITAATFERAYRTIDRFEWRGGGFGAWLFSIASNELVDHYRRQGRPQSPRGQAALGYLHHASATDDVEHIEGGGADVDTLLAALGTLQPRYQTAISLRYLADLSHEEAAAVMALSKPVMAVTLSRALKALRKAMETMSADTQRRAGSAGVDSGRPGPVPDGGVIDLRDRDARAGSSDPDAPRSRAGRR
ncbi:MAG: RNA polymerase sigma factor [Acidimicrobiales bacterium]